MYYIHSIYLKAFYVILFCNQLIVIENNDDKFI